MFKEFLFKLDIIGPLSVLLFTLILALNKRRISSFSNRILIAFVLAQLILNAIAAYLQSERINNLGVYHLNCLISLVIFSWYFMKVIRQKKIVSLGLIIFFILDFILLLTGHPFKMFPSYQYALSSFILVLYGLLLLNTIIEQIPTFSILSLKEFWITTGVLTYFGSSFLVFISYHYFSEVLPRNVYILWQVHNVFLALGCLFFLKAITSKQWIVE